MINRMPGLEKEMREFIVENLTNTEALSVTVILMNNIIALIVSFFIMFYIKFLMWELHTVGNLIFQSERLQLLQL